MAALSIALALLLITAAAQPSNERVWSSVA